MSPALGRGRARRYDLAASEAGHERSELFTIVHRTNNEGRQVVEKLTALAGFEPATFRLTA